MRPANLARRPFVNERLPNLVFAVAAVLMLGLTVRHAFLVRALLPGRTSALHDEVTRLEEESRRLRAEQASLRGVLPDPKAVARWVVIKELVDRRAFSWTGLFGRLEERLPEGARLVSIAPGVRKGDDHPGRAGRREIAGGRLAARAGPRGGRQPSTRCSPSAKARAASSTTRCATGRPRRRAPAARPSPRRRALRRTRSPFGHGGRRGPAARRRPCREAPMARAAEAPLAGPARAQRGCLRRLHDAAIDAGAERGGARRGAARRDRAGAARDDARSAPGRTPCDRTARTSIGSTRGSGPRARWPRSARRSPRWPATWGYRWGVSRTPRKQ